MSRNYYQFSLNSCAGNATIDNGSFPITAETASNASTVRLTNNSWQAHAVAVQGTSPISMSSED